MLKFVIITTAAVCNQGWIGRYYVSGYLSL